MLQAECTCVVWIPAVPVVPVVPIVTYCVRCVSVHVRSLTLTGSVEVGRRIMSVVRVRPGRALSIERRVRSALFELSARVGVYNR